jgi:hypothetical protein
MLGEVKNVAFLIDHHEHALLNYVTMYAILIFQIKFCFSQMIALIYKFAAF